LLLLLADAYAFSPSLREWLTDVLAANDNGETLRITFPSYAAAHIDTVARVAKKLEIPVIFLNREVP